MPKARKKGTTLLLETSSWELIERQFVQGVVQTSGEVYYPTVMELVEVHQVPYATLRRRILSEDWIEKRERWQASIGKWAHAASMKDWVEAAQRFDASCVSAAQKALDQIITHLNGAEADGVLLSRHDLDGLGRAAVSWQKVGRLSLGLSTENMASRVQQQEKEQDENAVIDTTLLSPREMDILDMFTSKLEQIQDKIIISEEIQEDSNML